MKRRFIGIVLSLIVFLGLSSLTHGAGFLIYEHGAAAMAMGGAFVALANNPTAIFHNPAGIAWLDGTQISFGPTLILPSASLSLPNYYLVDPTYPESVDTKKQMFYPLNFYISHKVSDRVALGFGFFSPYGLGTEWPEDYPLRFISTKDDMKTFFFNPTLALKLSENLSAGFGVSYVRASLKFELVNVDLADFTAYGGSIYELPIALDGSGNGWVLNAGALYKGEKFSLGFNWRGGFSVDFEGDLTIERSNVPTVFRDYVPPSGTASTSFNFPHIFAFGAAFNLTERLILTADVHYVLWSTYDKFEIEIDYIDPYIDPAEPDVVQENWKDSFVFRGGFQYQLSENFCLRLGALYDQTPQPEETMDPILPDANRVAFTGGFGFKSGSIVLDVAYQYEFFKDRTSPNRNAYRDPVTGFNAGLGTYSASAHLIGVSLGFVF